jgi:hypothetical protein
LTFMEFPWMCIVSSFVESGQLARREGGGEMKEGS